LNKNTYPPTYLAWIIWGLGAALYFTGFYQRVAPAVMTDQLMTDFNIGAAALGNFSAFYFYSYFVMQVPTGILADYWGPRRLLAAGCLVAALGTLLFAWAPTIVFANLGRLLIGGAVGVAYVALLKIATNWFAPNRFAMASGLALLIGICGAVCAGVPLRFLADLFGWRPVMFVSAAATLALTIAIWIFVRDDPAEKGYKSFATNTAPALDYSPLSVLKGLGMVFRYKNTWLLSLAPSGLVGPVLAFSGLWGGPVSYYTLWIVHFPKLCHNIDSSGGLGLWRTFYGGPVGQDRSQKAALFGRVHYCEYWMGGAYLYSGDPDLDLDMPCHRHRICFRRYDNRVCLCQGIGPSIPGRHCVGCVQYGRYVRPHDPSTVNWLDP